MKRLVSFVLLVAASRVVAGDIYLDLAIQSHAPNGVAYNDGLWNPLGVVRLRYRPSRESGFYIFLEHLSSIPNEKDSGGINSVGAAFTVRIGD